MKVILTEKPSVARDIARCLNCNTKHDGYFSGNGYHITWAFGHLVELQEPSDYHADWQRWTLASLPMIPEHFALKAKADDGAKKQLAIIQQLFTGADELICATDAGREGELIFRYILSWTNCTQKPFKRLWISALTDEAIRAGFAHLQDGAAFDGLYRAAKCRSEADWLVGLNATRLYTLKFGHGALWTIGRVQTPVLAMIVQRDKDIAKFTAEKFWELHSLYRDTDFLYVGGRFTQKADADKALQQVSGHDLTITSVTGKKELVLAPLLYDLTDLQKDLNVRYGYTAEQTLSYAQQLYEKKHITYPRTDSRHLTADVQATLPALLAQLRAKFEPQIAPINLANAHLSKRYIDDSKVTDHHALLPTLNIPTHLSEQESTVYDAIVVRFIAAFYPPCRKQITTVLAEIHDTAFKTTGVIIEDAGWQVLYKNELSKQDKEQKILPLFVVGESGAQQATLTQGKTTPPKPYSEAMLLSMMESAGKTCDDEKLKAALKEKGLGTPATRAAIIEGLLKRGYVQRQRKNLLSTESGRHLIALIGDERLKSASLTGEWEAKLKQIERNTYDAAQFMREICQFTQEIKQSAELPPYDVTKFGDCPHCKQPIIEGRNAYGCSAWKTGCFFVLAKQSYGVSIDYDRARQLLQLGKTLEGCTLDVDGVIFNAQLTLDASGKLGYNKLETQRLTAPAFADCPLCNGKIIETAKAYSCSEWRNGCKFTIWKTIAHKDITPTLAKQLIKDGETDILTGFKANSGKEFSAKLKWLEGKVVMDFAGQ